MCTLSILLIDNKNPHKRASLHHIKISAKRHGFLKIYENGQKENKIFFPWKKRDKGKKLYAEERDEISGNDNTFSC